MMLGIVQDEDAPAAALGYVMIIGIFYFLLNVLFSSIGGIKIYKQNGGTLKKFPTSFAKGILNVIIITLIAIVAIIGIIILLYAVSLAVLSSIN